MVYSLFTFDNLKRRWSTSPCFEGFGKLNHSMSLIMRWRSLTRSESHTKLCSSFERRFSRLLTLISSKLWPKNKYISTLIFFFLGGGVKNEQNHGIFLNYDIKGDNMMISKIIPEITWLNINMINIKNLHAWILQMSHINNFPHLIFWKFPENLCLVLFAKPSSFQMWHAKH